jgi:hypothetical protein
MCQEKEVKDNEESSLSQKQDQQSGRESEKETSQESQNDGIDSDQEVDMN